MNSHATGTDKGSLNLVALLMICLTRNVNTEDSEGNITDGRQFYSILFERERQQMEREEECVQFPAGLSEMGNMDGIPRRCSSSLLVHG
jgi:hypothetical protein